MRVILVLQKIQYYLAFLLKYAIYWLLFLYLGRFILILFVHSDFRDISWKEWFESYYHGFALDLSAICYILIFPALLLFVFPFPVIKKIINAYTILITVIASVLSVFDAAIYNDWNTKLNFRAFTYLQFGREGTQFVSTGDMIYFSVCFLVQLLFAWWMFRKLNWNETIHGYVQSKRWAILILPVFLLSGLLFLGIRGGWQLIPINESSAYFSDRQPVDDAGVNTLWYVGKQLISQRHALSTNPYQFLPAPEARQHVASLYQSDEDSIQILNTTRPNIVLIILESFTADVIRAIGGDSGIAPNLDTIIHNGLVFSNIYSQGFRTDQGLVSVLSGFPAQPNFSIIMQPEKSEHLATISQQLKDSGYHLSFYYGGELGFANMKSYLLHAGFDDLHGKEVFPTDEMGAKWGAHDGYVLQKQLQSLSNEPQPFFSGILTLSSHEPFFVPMKPHFSGDDDSIKFKNSCVYTDSCLGVYFREAKIQPWFKNTLFILVADHGCKFPRNRDFHDPNRFHIPIIFYGGALDSTFRGKQINKLGMQIDIPSTLLSQLHLSSAPYPWSNNLLNSSSKEFAYFTFDQGFGWKTQDGYFTYDFSSQKQQQTGSLPDEDIRNGKAFLQTLFDEYLKY